MTHGYDFFDYDYFDLDEYYFDEYSGSENIYQDEISDLWSEIEDIYDEYETDDVFGW